MLNFVIIVTISENSKPTYTDNLFTFIYKIIKCDHKKTVTSAKTLTFIGKFITQTAHYNEWYIINCSETFSFNDPMVKAITLRNITLTN